MDQSDVTESNTATTGTSASLDAKSKKTLADYVGDMVALESHIEEALDRQLKEAKGSSPAESAIQQFHDMVKRQRDSMKQLQSEVGSTGGNPIKKAGSAVLGAAAGVVNLVRTEGISKALRDDYTAFNLAAISYTMLNTTALALGDQRVADIAEQHLRGYARAVQQINHLIEQVVVDELAKDNHQVNRAAADQTRRLVDRAWKDEASSAQAF